MQSFLAIKTHEYWFRRRTGDLISVTKNTQNSQKSLNLQNYWTKNSAQSTSELAKHWML